MVGQAGAAQPAAPVLGRGREPRVRLVHVLWHGELLGPGERAVGLLALLEGVACAHPVALDAERHVRLQPHRHLGAAGVGGVAVLADQRPLGRRAAVVEARLADQLDLDAAVEAQDRPHQHVVGVVVGRRPGVRSDLVLVIPRAHRQRVANHDPAGRRLPGGGDDVGPGLVDARRWEVDAERSQPERAGLAIEQHAEHAGRVEARQAEPVDRAVGRDESAGVAVGEEGVVGYRREGRRCRGALWRGRVRGFSAALMSPPTAVCHLPCPATS